VDVVTDFDLTGITAELLEKYDRPGPRYTSYPTAPHFHDGFDDRSYAERLRQAAHRSREPLSMYVHIPFCESRCAYCGCNVVISPHRGPEEDYLATVDAELELLARSLGDRTALNQLHWGGGTPTYLNPGQCRKLWSSIAARFTPTDGAEIGIEIDPCVTTLEHLGVLRELGFNRLSMGVQDVNQLVQRQVGRVQPLELNRRIMTEARRLGFASVNVDLIYGLPGQTEESFRETVRTVVSRLAPDRVACFSYAHVPWIKPHQRALDEASLPAGWQKFRLFAGAATEFAAAGYRMVGFDHFAKPSDELASALHTGRLHRNFMGYTVMPATDQVGIGVTSIGDVAGAYAANRKNLARYQRAVARGQLPIARGIVRSEEDELRGAVIREIICNLRLDYRRIEDRFGVEFRSHFEDALADLRELSDDGLVELGERALRVTPRGRFFLRNICMPFDAYLRDGSGQQRFSRTV